MPITLANGQAAPAGYIITSGTSSSGQCQDPAGCYAEPEQAATPAAPATAAQALQLEPMRSTNYGGNMAGQCQVVVDPQTGVASQLCEAPQTGGTAADYLGLEPNMTPMPAQPAQAARPTSPTMDPYQTWRAQAFLAQGMAGRKANVAMPDVNKAVALSALGASQQRAQELMAMGYDYDTALAQAQREALDGSGYRGAGVASGATGAATKQIGDAAAREAELMYLAGTGEMTDVGRNLFGQGTGQVFQGPGGVMYRSRADGSAEPVNVSAAAAANPLTAPAMMSPTPGGSLKRLENLQTYERDVNKAVLQNNLRSASQVDLENLRQQGRIAVAVTRGQIQQQLRAGGGADKLDKAAVDNAARAEWTGACQATPFEVFKKVWVAQQEQNAKLGIDLAVPCQGAAPASSAAVAP